MLGSRSAAGCQVVPRSRLTSTRVMRPTGGHAKPRTRWRPAASAEPLHEDVQDVSWDIALHARQLEHRAEWDARPLRHADAAEPPLRARRDLAHELLEEPASVAGALDEADDRARGKAKQVIEGQL